MSGRSVDQLGLVAALYLYFNYRRQKIWQHFGVGPFSRPVGPCCGLIPLL